MGFESRLDGAGITAADGHPFQNIAVGVEPDHIAVQEPHRGALYGADRSHCRRLSRLLHLDLGSRGHELAQEQHGGGVDPCGGKAGIPGPAIAQPKAPRPGGMGEYGPSGDQIAQELGAGVPTILLGLGQAVQPLPSRDLKLGDMLLELGPLQSYPLRRDQGYAAPDPVGLNPGQVPVAGDLLLLGGLPIDAYGAVPDYGPDLVIGRRVLEPCHPFVDPNLLHIALHLLRPRLPGGDAHRSPDIVCHQNR